MSSTFERRIEEIVKDQRQAMEAVYTYRKTLDFLDEVKAKFTDESKNLSIYVECYSAPNVKIYLNDMHDMLGILRFLREAGYKSESFKDYPESNQRCYQLTGDVHILAQLNVTENAKCKWVQVGVKEVPVMKLECSKE